MSELTHFGPDGKPRMVEVGHKPETARLARARARIRMKPETLERIESGTVEKGDVLGTARLAGIMATKRTHELIPLCYPLRVSSVEVELTCAPPEHVEVEAIVRAMDRTGVEMEALVAASTAARHDPFGPRCASCVSSSPSIEIEITRTPASTAFPTRSSSRFRAPVVMLHAMPESVMARAMMCQSSRR